MYVSANMAPKTRDTSPRGEVPQPETVKVLQVSVPYPQNRLFGNEWGLGDLPGGVVIHQK